MKTYTTKTTEEILKALDAGDNGWVTPLEMAAAGEIRRLMAEVATLKATISNLGWQINSDRQGGL